jgi:hypothetical protein
MERETHRRRLGPPRSGGQPSLLVEYGRIDPGAQHSKQAGPAACASAAAGPALLVIHGQRGAEGIAGG